MRTGSALERGHTGPVAWADLAMLSAPGQEASGLCGFASGVGALALRCLYEEVALAPKPGLVSPVDNGSHRDMNFQTFMRSLNALRDYFPQMVQAGLARPGFAPLQQLGLAAEQRMLAATGGVNTHRGAIFNLGLLCAAAGWLAAEQAYAAKEEETGRWRDLCGGPGMAHALCHTVSLRWGGEILASAQGGGKTHGLEVLRRYAGSGADGHERLPGGPGLACNREQEREGEQRQEGKAQGWIREQAGERLGGGARGEAAAGFPSALLAGLPAYRRIERATGDRRRAAVEALFALMARLADTNLLWRGGLEGLASVQQWAADFLARGGVLAADWQTRAEGVHRNCVARHLSPGGSADLLAVSLFLGRMEDAFSPVV